MVHTEVDGRKEKAPAVRQVLFNSKILPAADSHVEQEHQDRGGDGHRDVDEGLGAVGNDRKGAGSGIWVHGLPKKLPDAGDKGTKVGQGSEDADRSDIVNVFVMGGIEDAVAGFPHEILVAVHGDDVVGVRTVADELLQESGVAGEVFHGEAPVEAASGAPAVIKDQEVLKRRPQRGMAAAVRIDEHRDNQKDRNNQKEKPAAAKPPQRALLFRGGRRRCPDVFHLLFPPKEHIKAEHEKPQKKTDSPEGCGLPKAYEHRAAAPVCDGLPSQGAEARQEHGTCKGRKGNEIAKELSAGPPGRERQKGKERRSCEDRIVTDAHDDCKGGNDHRNAGQKLLSPIVGYDKQADRGGQMKGNHIRIGIDVSDTGNEGIAVLLIDVIEQPEQIKLKEICDAPELRQAGGKQVGVEMSAPEMIEAGHHDIGRKEHEPQHQAV